MGDNCKTTEYVDQPWPIRAEVTIAKVLNGYVIHRRPGASNPLDANVFIAKDLKEVNQILRKIDKKGFTNA